MVINLKLMSILATNAGLKPNETVQFELPDGATLQQLLLAIDDRFGTVLPPRLWDREAHQFTQHVTLILDGAIAGDLNQPMHDQATVMALVSIAGG